MGTCQSNHYRDSKMKRERKRMKRITLVAVLAAFVAVAIMFAVACSRTAEETYNPIIEPANFVAKIDNQYFPLAAGTTFIYQGETQDGIERNEVYVTHQTRKILGVTCSVVRDRVSVDGKLVEETFDWYAQDMDKAYPSSPHHVS